MFILNYFILMKNASNKKHQPANEINETSEREQTRLFAVIFDIMLQKDDRIKDAYVKVGYKIVSPLLLSRS